MTRASTREFRASRVLAVCVFVAVAAYAGLAFFSIVAWSPQVPYADQWRHYASLLDGPVPAVLFAADNGHVEVVPNLARLLDLLWLGGSERLQIALAALLLSATLVIGLRVIWRDPAVPETRLAQTTVFVIGLCWLGHMRALTQAGDGVHVYLVMVLVALASVSLLDLPGAAAWRRLILACACCIAATLSFGSGIAAFAAVFALLFMQRAAVRLWLAAAAMAFAGLVAYFLLAGANDTLHPDPRAALLTTCRLLGTPFIYVFWPLLDPAAAAAVPAPLHDSAVAIANAWTAHFGDIRRAVMPQALFGACAVLWLLAVVWRNGRVGPASPRSARFGLALAAFGAAVCALIAIIRQNYFDSHVDQIVALRYVPWSSLCWAGLGVVQLARTRHARVALIAVALAMLLLLPSEVGMAVLARRVRNVAEDTALAAAVGVLPQDMPLGETDPVDVEAALPRLQTARTAMFAWPETALLGKAPPSSVSALDAQRVSVLPVANRLGDPGRLIEAHASSACATSRALLVEGGVVVGLLRHVSGELWRGVARGSASVAPLLVCP